MSGTGKKRGRLVADKRYPAAKPAAGKRKTSKPAAKKKAPARKPAGRKAAARKTTRRRTRRTKRKFNPVVGFFLGIFGWILRMMWRIGWRVAAVVGVMVGAGVFYYYSTLPPVEQLVDGRVRGSVILLDRDNRRFASRGDLFGGIVTANTVSPHLKNAVVATEDKRFYRHFGLSPRGVASAIRINLAAGRGPLSGNGGSTLTQQTAKLLCLGKPYDPTKWDSEKAYEDDCRQGSLWRKIKEAVYALALEAKYSKDDILTIYLNRAFLGAGARGFEAAAQRYFGKSASDVNPAEAAMLAGLLKAPTRYAPTNNLQRSQDRALTVLKLMEEQGYLTSAQAAQARENPAVLSKAAQARAGGYFADWVMSSGPSFFTKDTTEDVIIRTTLDPRIQRAAEDALTYIFETKVSAGSKAQAAIIVMSADGAVRAMVGGRQTKVSGAFNRATQALRQTGSTFKPFVYAAALDLGYSPNDYVMDGPLTINIPGSGPWTPKNYGGKYYGRVTLTEALMRSLNTATVRVSESVGRDAVRAVATGFGIREDLAAGPALALGASESTLIEMTGAYAGILNGGRSVTPYGLVELRLQGDSEPVMKQEGGYGERVISKQAAGGLTYMMNQVVERGTGRRARIDGWQLAGKTGTTQKARDAWFIGFSADYVTGIWMGYDDNTPLKGVTGGGLPASIWHETMVRVLDGIEPKPLPMIKPAPPEPVQPAPQPQSTRDDVAERLLRDVLENIIDGGR
ncbi:transglycosylase domain-containing protein [Profundibacter sp.]